MGKTVLNGAHVLLLEDDALINLGMADLLQEMGCQVSPFMHLTEALAATDQQLPDVAVLDVNIKGILSYELAEKLERAGVPIVFVTGYGSPALSGKWNEFPHCRKPCVPTELKQVMIKTLRRRA